MLDKQKLANITKWPGNKDTGIKIAKVLKKKRFYTRGTLTSTYKGFMVG